MKVQLKGIVLAVPALSKLSAGDLQLRLAYKLKRMITALQKEADFFAEQRQKIFEKYGTAKENGSFDFSAENEPKAAGELEELLAMEVTPEVEAIDIPITENLLLALPKRNVHHDASRYRQLDHYQRDPRCPAGCRRAARAYRLLLHRPRRPHCHREGRLVDGKRRLSGSRRQNFFRAVITKYGHSQGAIGSLQILEAGHPVPDESSADRAGADGTAFAGGLRAVSHLRRRLRTV